MILQSVIRTIVYGLPLLTFVICGILIVISMRDSIALKESRLKRLLFVFYLLGVIVGLGVIFLSFESEFRISGGTLLCLLCFFTAIANLAFYNFIYLLTSSNNKAHISPLHCLLNVFVFGGLIVGSLVWSFDGNVAIVVCSLQSLIYIVFVALMFPSSKNLKCRQRVLLLGSCILFPLIYIAALAMPQMEIYTALLLFVPILALTTFHLIIISNYIGHNYLLSDSGVETDLPYTPERTDRRIYRRHTKEPVKVGEVRKLDKQYFEEYFRTHKPYLNLDFKITDLLAPFNTNRTYVSAFINRTYGVGFSQYVNNCRLRELERLKKLPYNKGQKIENLLPKAGFASYRSYMRAKQFIKENQPDGGDK